MVNERKTGERESKVCWLKADLKLKNICTGNDVQLLLQIVVFADWIDLRAANLVNSLNLV